MLKNILSRFVPALASVVTAASLLLSPLSTQATETIIYLHNDISGSPQAATDASGNLLWKESYTPYGERTVNSPASSTGKGSNQLYFHGKKVEDLNGGVHLSYFGARYYDPSLGRFLQIDPVPFVESNLHSFNRYTYGNNNPYRFVDPDGRAPYDLQREGKYGGTSGMNAFDRMNQIRENEATLREAGPRQSLDPALRASGSVSKYEVGTFNSLKSRSSSGDGLDIHHAPQKNPAAQSIGGYSGATGPSIAVPRAEHARIPTIKGNYEGSARDLLAKDIRDLRNYTNAPNGALRDLIDLNKQLFPESLGK